MKQTKYTLPNGVESYIIESEEGSVLVRNDGFAIKNIALIKEKHNLLNIFLIHYMKGPSIKQQLLRSFCAELLRQ